MLKSDPGAQLLKEFAVNPWVKERLRQLALLELKKIFPPGPCFNI